MTRHFNDLQPTSGIVHAASYMMMSLLIEGHIGPKQYRRLLAAINRGVEYIVGSRDINLGCVHETMLSDTSKPYIDD